MPEPINAPQPEQKPPQPAPPPSPQEAELRAELERERGKRKLLKTAAIVLLCLFVLVAGVAVCVYHRVTSALLPPPDTIEGLARPSSVQYGPEGGPQPFAAPGAPGSMPASTLGLFSGAVSGDQAAALQQAASPENAENAMKALSKYMDRPIVKEFLSDLRKDPEVAKALAGGQNANPLAIVALAQRSGSAQALVARYATRPAFIKLMMDMAKDPELKQLSGGMGGVPGQAVQVPPLGQAGPAGQPAQDEGDIKFDPSAISGGQPSSGATPSPVDSQ